MAWDFSLLAALAAPRPLLLANSDKDRIFPLDGVLRIHRQLKSVYKLFNAEDKLGLLITEGPHRDTQDLQLPAFRWMNRWLKKEETLINHAAVQRFSPEAVKVFKHTSRRPDKYQCTRIVRSGCSGPAWFQPPRTSGAERRRTGFGCCATRYSETGPTLRHSRKPA